MERYILIALCCAAAALLITLKRARALGKLFSSSLGGIAGLLALDMFPVLSGLVTANLFSLCVCAVFGLPGLAALLMMRMICAI